MAIPNHYQTLELLPDASHQEIKQAYRRLAKQFHPDSKTSSANHDRITQINAAYEILGDRDQRAQYDRQREQVARLQAVGVGVETAGDRQQRAAAAQATYQRQRQSGRKADAQLDEWLKRVYRPVNRRLNQIMKPLNGEVRTLSADPFDDELMAGFQTYLEECRSYLEDAQRVFQSMPNPGNVASVAAHLYYAINQVEDGIEELERFTLNYDDSYLHAGRELFRISKGLKQEAQDALKSVV